MAENITLNFRVEGKRGMQQALQSVNDALGSVEGASASAAVTLKKQENVAGGLVKKVGEIAVAHGVWHGAQVAVNKAAGRTVTHTSALASASTAAKKGVSKLGTALKSGAASASRFAARMAPLAASFAPFAIGGGVAIGLLAINKRLREIGQTGAAVETVSDSFDSLARHVGTTGQALRKELSAATAGTVRELDLMKTSVIALNSEAIKSPEVLAEIARASRILGRTVGKDTTDAFDNLVRGIGLMRPQLLKDLGVMVSVQEATRDWAAANNVAVSAMTDAQKHAAFLEAVLVELRAATGRVSSETDDLATSEQRVATAAENFADSMNEAVAESEPLKEVGQDLATIKVGAFELAEALGDDLLRSVTDLSSEMTSWVTGPLADAVDRMRELAGLVPEVEPIAATLGEQTIEGVSTRPFPSPPRPSATTGFRTIQEMTALGRRQTRGLEEAVGGIDPVSLLFGGEVERLLRRPSDILGTRSLDGMVRAHERIIETAGPAADATEDAAEAFEGTADAAGDAAEKMSFAEQAVVSSTASMAGSLVAGARTAEAVFSNLIQGIVRVAEREVGGFLGLVGIPFIGGILQGVLSLSGRDRPQPVQVEEFGSRAEDQLERSSRGPETVTVQILNPQGEEISRVTRRLREFESRDGVSRIPRGAD